MDRFELVMGQLPCECLPQQRSAGLGKSLRGLGRLVIAANPIELDEEVPLLENTKGTLSRLQTAYSFAVSASPKGIGEQIAGVAEIREGSGQQESGTNGSPGQTTGSGAEGLTVPRCRRIVSPQGGPGEALSN
jgi:hypothetical protein